MFCSLKTWQGVISDSTTGQLSFQQCDVFSWAGLLVGNGMAYGEGGRPLQAFLYQILSFDLGTGI
jgi:hypothetical protein